MKVVIYSGIIPSTTFIERLINGLAESGVKILLHGHRKTIFKKYVSENVKVIGYSGRLSKLRIVLKYLFLFLLSSPGKFYKLYNSYSGKKDLWSFLSWFVRTAPVIWYKPDILHLQWAKSVEDWIFLQDFGIKIIVSLRGAHINYSPLVDTELADMYSRIFPRVDAFHGVSKAICLEAAKYGADLEKCKVVYSGLNLKKFSFENDKKFDSGIVKIISVGRAHWKKGYNIALDAMKLLEEQNFAVDYKIIGGNNEELIFQVNDLDLSNSVHLDGNVSNEEVKILIKEADVLLLPSIEEGIPNVILEAMALGTIVISTDCGGVSEVIEDQKNGFLVPLRDPAAISEKIKAVKKISCSNRQEIREQARKTIESRHSLQKMIDEMKSLYSLVKE